MAKKIYGVLGAGMQGTAAAYDLAKFGDAEKVYVGDLSLARAEQQSSRLNALLGEPKIRACVVDVASHESLLNFMKPLDGVMGAVSYGFNPKITEAAIETRTHMVDLGGNTDIVFEQHKLSNKAKSASITIVPDCGLMPGLGNMFAVFALETLDEVYDVEIRCGGLPQNPKPPLNYMRVFSMQGLTNEYFGKAHILREGAIQEVDTFTELEEITFQDPIGKCEAFTTSGGTSTCPWSFKGKIKNYNYKTVRYPGHYAKIKAALELGLLDTKQVIVKGQSVSPRDLFHAVVEPKITFPDDKDLAVLRATCKGKRDGKNETLTLETIDYFDDKTGFSAMERTTAFSAALVLEMIVNTKHAYGVCRMEETISGKTYLKELQKHGISIQKKNVRPVKLECRR